MNARRPPVASQNTRAIIQPIHIGRELLEIPIGANCDVSVTEWFASEVQLGGLPEVQVGGIPAFSVTQEVVIFMGFNKPNALMCT